MSLESINKKLHAFEKEVSLKKYIFYSFILGAISVIIGTLINPTFLLHYQTLLLKFTMLSLLTLAFMTMYMMFGMGIVIGGIIITWILAKSRDRLYEKNGVLIGNSLTTNFEFLSKFAKGLFPKLIGFIKSYNDPKFEELESRQLNSENKINKLEENDEMTLPHIARSNRNTFDNNFRISQLEKEVKELKTKLKEYEKKDSAQKQQIGERFHAQDINENTKIDDKNKKFERKN